MRYTSPRNQDRQDGALGASRQKTSTSKKARPVARNAVVSLSAVAASTDGSRRAVGLLGFLAKAEVDAHFRQQMFKTHNGEDPFDLWRAAETHRKGLLAVPPGAAVRIPEDLQHLAAEVRRRKTYQRHYESQADYQFCTVPIESLISPQWYADLDYVDELKARLGTAPSTERAFQFAFVEGQINAPLVTANQVQFTSPGLDLFVDATPIVQRAEDGSFTITVLAGSRPNYIQVALLDDRLVLVNGVHKVCALYALGLRTCFCALRVVTRLEESGLNFQATSLYRDEVFKSMRPALVTDFMNPSVAVPLRMKSMYQVMQVSINVGQIRVPALPPR
jgi:hypothetical protein